MKNESRAVEEVSLVWFSFVLAVLWCFYLRTSPRAVHVGVNRSGGGEGRGGRQILKKCKSMNAIGEKSC